MSCAMTTPRAYLGLALALVLTLTGQTMALARTAPDPAGHMVLCTGTGPVTVLIDAEGQPTGAVHICPDCALSLLDNPGGAPQALIRAATWSSLQAPDISFEFSDRAPECARARGPPRIL